MMVAQTHRLILRELTPADAPRLLAIYSDPQTMAFMGPPPTSVEDEAAGIAAHVDRYYRGHGFGLWAVVERATGELVGRCGLLRFDLRGEPQTEISYLLARAYWGKGYATESAEAVVGLAFDRFGVDRLYALIQPANGPSVKVAERLGFRREGAVEYKGFGVVDLYFRGRKGGQG